MVSRLSQVHKKAASTHGASGGECPKMAGQKCTELSAALPVKRVTQTQSSAGLLYTILLFKIVGDTMGCLSEKEKQRDRERPSSCGSSNNTCLSCQEGQISAQTRILGQISSPNSLLFCGSELLKLGEPYHCHEVKFGFPRYSMTIRLFNM